MKKKKLTMERLKEALHYDPDTGYFTWLITPRGGKKKGDRAGSINKIHGYVVMGIDGEGFYGHQLAWFYQTGTWPANQIDHRDLNPSNNAFENLREATMADQRKNQRVRRDNIIGIKGVKKTSTGRYVARITVNKIGMYLGTYDTIEEAKMAHDEAALKHFGEFARLE